MPTVTGSIDGSGADGQNPTRTSSRSASRGLKIKWSSTNADTVAISPLDATGLGPSGEVDIPTQEANYSITAKGKGGTSQPFNIEVHTNPDGAVVAASSISAPAWRR